jgi:hypothetical protein
MIVSRIQAAFEFYSSHIYDEALIALLQKHNLKVAGSVPSVKWELFGALLTGSKGAGDIGADLVGWEVKSATAGSSYEYQYHLNTGLAKLDEDCKVNHLFCSYQSTYDSVTVRALSGAVLAKEFFKKWKPLYIKNYDEKAKSSRRRQRFRKAVTNSFVEKHGELILEISNSELVFTSESALESFDK